MISHLIRSLNIDISYAVNSFIYGLRKLPILDDLITDDIYNSKISKRIISVISIILSCIKLVVFRLSYFAVIYFISIYLFDDSKYFSHIFFLLTMIGLFINNKLLNTSVKRYLSILVFNMNARSYMFSSFSWDLILNVILNSMGFIVFNNFTNISLVTSILLVIICLLSRVVGEGFNILYYKKFHYIWYNNYPLYFGVLGLFLGLCFTPLIGISVNDSFLLVVLCLLSILGVISFIYLLRVKDYKIMFKQLNTLKNALNSKESNAYARQSMVEIKNKHKDVDESKIKDKKGYDLFNTLFYERHKEILVNSVKRYSLIILVIYLGVIGYIFINKGVASITSDFLHNQLGMFVIIMYFINRGSIVTQAMFYNCDHAMLTYNFYREKDVILGLFKMRLLSIIKINLIPSVIIGIGNSILFYISGGTSLITYISSFMFIVMFSIFFSVHYLVLYYLLQPFNKDMQMKKISYGVASFLTYYFSYVIFFDLVVSTVTLSIISIIFVVVYIILGLFLVNRLAPRTFKLNR